MASSAKLLVFERPARNRPDLFTPSAERRDFYRYPSGHEVRVYRAHLERVLAVKAALSALEAA